jgi:aminopeptidase N
MSDASLASPRLPTIHRADYRPPSWLVPTIALSFDLGLDSTRVRARLQVVRNPAAAADPVLRLNGDGLEPAGVSVDGVATGDWRREGADLLIELAGAAHEVEVETVIAPAANTQLMGLYASNGMLCTQCEAEGFRRITFFPDRPDVLSTYRVRMEGDKALFPVLLSNGNCVASGDVAGTPGRHWAEWHDPWPKPSYLFALVAGQLVANSGTFTTMGGREVTLNIWVREGDQQRTGHALQSLINAMRWDEEAFGREYDLDLYNVVAVADFNMGAMENKGLNVFNTRYVLADPETATDADYDGVEGVIGHEYFHNWSGNRVTCRDWFQLSLKEGFTVLRDQLFSAAMNSAPVKRIEDVRMLRAVQFPEDSGPLAHPIRPDSYQEISNFYTATVYNKGAEVIRMMRTLAGAEAFRKGCDLYFDRHDGEAATCEDFIRAIEDGAGLDLAQFRLWYSQAGTPQVTVRLEHAEGVATLHLAQTVPATPGQPAKAPMPIPLRMALFDRATGKHAGEHLVVLDRAEASFAFPGFAERPVLSINRGFSAPVAISADTGEADLVFLAAHDDDPFARYEAMQALALGHLVAASEGRLDPAARAAGEAAIARALCAVLVDPALDDLMRGELMSLPAEAYIAEQIRQCDPQGVRREREALKTALARSLHGELTALLDRTAALPFTLDATGKGARKAKGVALGLLAAGWPEEAAQRAAAQYDAASNMTDRQGALAVLVSLEGPQRAERLADFHRRFAGNALVIDKWFGLQAGSLHPAVLDHIRELAQHPDFTLANPNRVRALYMMLAMNAGAFHAADGTGYRMIADLILELDPKNPQTAARFVAPLGRWRRIEPGRAALMKAELQRIAAAPGLSKDTAEQVGKSLG